MKKFIRRISYFWYKNIIREVEQRRIPFLKGVLSNYYLYIFYGFTILVGTLPSDPKVAESCRAGFKVPDKELIQLLQYFGMRRESARNLI